MEIFKDLSYCISCSLTEAVKELFQLYQKERKRRYELEDEVEDLKDSVKALQEDNEELFNSVLELKEKAAFKNTYTMPKSAPFSPFAAKSKFNETNDGDTASAGASSGPKLSSTSGSPTRSYSVGMAGQRILQRALGSCANQVSRSKSFIMCDFFYSQTSLDLHFHRVD